MPNWWLARWWRRWRLAVAVIAVLGPQRLARAAAPLSEAMRVAGVNWLIPVVQIGAAVAALGYPQKSPSRIRPYT